MKLYQVYWEGPDDLMLCEWAGTQADAKRIKKERDAEIQEVEVPTDKPSLLAWLNKHLINNRGQA